MSLLDHIVKLRQKPEDTRRQLTFWFSASFTGLVAIVWLASLSFGLRAAPAGQVASVGATKDATVVATSTAEDNSWMNSNKTKIIEGWKVITK